MGARRGVDGGRLKDVGPLLAAVAELAVGCAAPGVEAGRHDYS